MPRPTQKQYDLLVKTFSDQVTAHGKPDFPHAAAIAQVTAKDARMAWFRGWRDEPPVLVPINQIVERSRIAARAKMARAHRRLLDADLKAATDASEDLAAQVAVELFASRQALVAAQEMISTSAQLIHGARPVRDRLLQTFAEASADPDIPQSKLLRIMREINEHALVSMQFFKLYTETQNKRMGKADLTIEHKHEVVPSGEQALENMKAFLDSMKKYAPKSLVLDAVPASLPTPLPEPDVEPE